VLPGVTVTLTETPTGLTDTTSTNAAGLYRFTALKPSTYSLKAELAGFATFVRDGLILEVGRTLDIDIEMKLATVAETITVTGESPLVDVRESDIGGVVHEEEIRDIPINTRDFQTLALLVPGSKIANNFDPTKSRVPAISFGTSATGRGINVSVDGGDNNDDAVGGVLQQYSMDSVQEFEVVTSRLKPEYGRSAGGAINVVTKSGTNQFRGTAFEFFRDKGLNATTQPEKDAGGEKGPFRRHQLGFAMGGPIQKDRAFFFVNYERIIEDVNTVLTDSGVTYPAAFVAQHGGFGLIEQPFRRNYLTAKLTAQLKQDQRLDVRLGWEDNSREGDQIGEGFTNNASRDQAAIQTNDFWSVLAKHTWTASQKALNEFVFQYNYFDNIIIGVDQPSFSQPAGPTLHYPTVTFGQNGNTPQETFQEKFQFKDDFSYSLDTHEFKFGAEVMRVAPFGADVPFGSNGTFYYDSDTAVPDAATFFSITSGPGLAQRNNTQMGFYAQDDWRVNDQLTLNLGVRYDVELGTLSDIPFADEISRDLRRNQNSPWFGLGDLKDDINNVAPRLGFVWDVGGKGLTAVRGGYGIFYDQVILNTTLFNDLDVGNPPFRLISIASPPFGPNNIPSGDALAATYGFGLFNRTVSPDFKLPHTWQASVGVTHQFSPTLALDVDFIHSEASDLSKMSNPNERRFDTNGDGRKDNNSRRFFPDRAGRLRVLVPYGQDEYNGLQMGLRKRMSNNVQFNVNYTLGEVKGNAQGLYDAADCFECIGDERDIGPLPNDVRHRFVIGGIFQLPADFQISALVQAESARPAGRGADSSRDLNDNGDGGTSGHNVDWAPGPNGEPAGRGNFRGDPTYLLDLRIVKIFRTGGNTNLQVMFEAFNLFNTVNWGGAYEIVPESANFGKPTGLLFTNQFQAQLGVRFTF
jgi:hypothetical protein